MRSRTLLIGLLLAASTAMAANDATSLRDAGQVPVQLVGGDDAGDARVYIVQLAAPSVAEQRAAMAKASGAPVAAGKIASIDRDSPSVRAYAAELDEGEARVLAKAGPGVQPIYSYRYSLNGFAARMTPAQAQHLAHLPEVQNVWEDEVRPMATNHSPQFLGLFDADRGLRSVNGLDGDGVVIGVIDSGIAPEHPALADTRPADRPRLCRSSWADATILGRWLCGRFRCKTAKKRPAG